MGEICLVKIDDNLIFLLNIMPNRNFTNIIKNSGGQLGSPSKKLNNQYRLFLINKLRRSPTPKVIKAILNEVKTISDEDLEGNNILPLLCKYYLKKDIDKFNSYKKKYYDLNEKKSENNVKKSERKVNGNNDNKHLEKIIEKQKKKIVDLNGKYQALNKNIQHIQNKSNQLNTINSQQKRTILDQSKQLDDATTEIAKLRSKLLSKKASTNRNSIYQEESEKLRLKLSNTMGTINYLKEENAILKQNLTKLQKKLISLTTKQFLLVGMPIGFKYGSIRIPKDVQLQIAVNSLYVNLKDKQIIEYSSIDDLMQKLTKPLDSYKQIIIFNGEVTRKDIIELNNRVNKDKLSYVNGAKELEELLDRKGENK